MDIDLSQEELDRLCVLFSKLVVTKVINSPEIKGSTSFLESLFLVNKKCVVVSATPTKEVKEIVDKRNLSKYFTQVYGSPDSKADNLKSIINKYKIQPSDVIFFGDANADLEAADKLGISFVGIGEDICKMIDASNKEIYWLKDFLEI